MRKSDTAVFTDPDDYSAAIRCARIHLVFNHQRRFSARLTRVNLPRLHLLHSRENLPRIAYVSLAAGPVFISFPTRFVPPPILNGVELQSGDIVFHGHGERMHHRTGGASQWGLIWFAPDRLAAYGKVCAGLKLVPPHIGRILRPSSSGTERLLRLHANACRLAETEPEVLVHWETARGLEQELVLALVSCFTDASAHEQLVAQKSHANIMVQFEDALTAHCDRPLRMLELCVAIGVPERTLRVACAEFLGMGPNAYIRLRRLNMVRAALRRVDPATTSVSELARRYGFTELGRFAVAYRNLFGEAPSTTLRGNNIS